MPRTEARLTDDEKAAWQQFCKDSGVKESDMLRMMIRRVSGDAVPIEIPGWKESKSGKITFRLTESDQRKLMKRVKEEGFPNRTNWTTSVVMAALHREPVLTDSEIAALRESNRELAAIGRNLNQVARALNIEFREGDRIKLQAIEALAERIEQHKGEVAGLLSRNLNRWSDDGQSGE